MLLIDEEGDCFSRGGKALGLVVFRLINIEVLKKIAEISGLKVLKNFKIR